MNENNLEELGKRFKELRLAKGWSQLTCARRLGYSNKTSVSKIELGQQGIKRSQIAKFAEVLGTTPEYLMGWKEENTTQEAPYKTDFDIEVGERVRLLREKRGLSQTQLAIGVGYSGKSAVSYIENGDRGIKPELIPKFAEVLGTTPEYLMGWKEAPLSPELQAIVGDRPLSPAMRELLESVQTLSDDQCEQITDFMNYLIEKRTK